MPIVQGQGHGTARKQERFYSAMRIGMHIFAHAPKTQGFPFWLFDTNCGSGFNEEVGVLGSPLVAHLAAHHAGLAAERRRFFFCDREEEKIRELVGRLAMHDLQLGSFPLPGDNEEGLELFARHILRSGERPQYATGLIVVDPNGWWYRNGKDSGPPVEALKYIAGRFPRLDILLNLNVQAYRRMRGAGIPVLAPLNVLRAFGREHWLLGRIVVAHHSFLVAVGRNIRTGDHARVQMFHLNSDNGAHILRWVENDSEPELQLAV